MRSARILRISASPAIGADATATCVATSTATKRTGMARFIGGGRRRRYAADSVRCGAESKGEGHRASAVIVTGAGSGDKFVALDLAVFGVVGIYAASRRPCRDVVNRRYASTCAIMRRAPSPGFLESGRDDRFEGDDPSCGLLGRQRRASCRAIRTDRLVDSRNDDRRPGSDRREQRNKWKLPRFSSSRTRIRQQRIRRRDSERSY